MTRRIKKSTICMMMALVIMVASFATTNVKAFAATTSETTDVTARASAPYWGATYLDPGKGVANVYVDVTKGGVGSATLKSWDFPSNVSFIVNVYSPSNVLLQESVLFGTNTELKGAIRACYETGQYRLEFKVISGNAGGWLGAWLY